MRAPLSRPCTIWLCNPSSPSCRAGITPFPSHVPLPFLNETQALCWHRASQGVAASPLHSLKVTRSPAFLGRDACLLWAHSKGFLGPAAWPLPGCHFLSHAHRATPWLSQQRKSRGHKQSTLPRVREGTGRASRDVGVMGTEATAWRGRREQGSPTTAHRITVMPHGAWGSSGPPPAQGAHGQDRDGPSSTA